MGLDQFLHRKIYIGNKWRDPKDRITINIPKSQKTAAFPVSDIKNEKISEIVEEIGYWRKANAIHKWFVDNIQDGNDDCGEYRVNEEQLNKLLKLCETVIANPGMAYKILPTEDGFYFGSTDYDEYYHQDIKDTKAIIEEALKDPSNEVYYSSSW